MDRRWPSRPESFRCHCAAVKRLSSSHPSIHPSSFHVLFLPPRPSSSEAGSKAPASCFPLFEKRRVSLPPDAWIDRPSFRSFGCGVCCTARRLSRLRCSNNVCPVGTVPSHKKKKDALARGWQRGVGPVQYQTVQSTSLPSLPRYFFMTSENSFSSTTAPLPEHFAFFCSSEQRPSRSKSPLWTLGQVCSFSL